MERFETILKRVEDVLHVLGCAALVLIAVLINADILGRLFFRTPLQFQFEMVEFYLMPAVATLSLSRVFRENGHLCLEFISPQTFGPFWPYVRIFMLLCSAAFFGAVSYMSGRFTLQAFQRDEVYFGIIDWPLGWAYLSVPLACSVLTVRLLFEITRKRSATSAPAL